MSKFAKKLERAKPPPLLATPPPSVPTPMNRTFDSPLPVFRVGKSYSLVFINHHIINQLKIESQSTYFFKVRKLSVLITKVD